MFFPMLKKIGLEKMTVTDFPGLDRRETARIGGFREMRNLCGEGYPTLRTRQARGLIATVTKPGGLTAKDALIWVDGTRICVNGETAGPVLTEGEKDLISMGAYLIVFPDKVYLNTKDLTDYGSLECERIASAGVAISLCDAEGKAYSGVVQSVGAPEDPEEGTLWMDVSGAEPVLRQYGESGWSIREDTYVKIAAGGIGVGFAAGLVLSCGCSTGGLDILGLYLSKKNPKFTVGRFCICFNVCLYTLCFILFNATTAIYSAIYNILNNLFLDRLHQQNVNVELLIFTKKNDPELPRFIMDKLDRGVTYWTAHGAYTGDEVQVLCVCLSKYEVGTLQQVMQEIDPKAFFIVQEGIRTGGNYRRHLN